jgi:hypothetical protein
MERLALIITMRICQGLLAPMSKKSIYSHFANADASYSPMPLAIGHFNEDCASNCTDADASSPIRSHL